uniref:Expp1 protein n=1 Tax=Quercus lobata TaxID=97700 RepID=A0A7N2KN28_QUELO
MAMAMAVLAMLLLLMMTMMKTLDADNTNGLYQPCGDTKIQRSDGFTFGIAFSTKDSFYYNQNLSHQLSPCDRRLSLATLNSQLAVFRPKVDGISLLTINTSSFSPICINFGSSADDALMGATVMINMTLNKWDAYGGYMVAFAGRKYAARSLPAFVANSTYIVTSFTLVLEFQKGRLQNLYWKRDGCASCSGKSNFVCLNKQDCAIRTSSCKNRGGSVDCSLGIQLAFSGTDKHLMALNSWYEVENLRQYSLYGLYSNLKNSLTNQYNDFF